MKKRIYLSPEFEWLEIEFIEDVLSGSIPDFNVDPVQPDPDDFFGGDGENPGLDGGGEGGDGEDLGEDW